MPAVQVQMVQHMDQVAEAEPEGQDSLEQQVEAVMAA
jgi:hypothetical protein